MAKLEFKKKYETYQEYKDSGVEWVGYIPADWDMASSRRLFSATKDLIGQTNTPHILSLTLGGVIPRVLDGSGKNPANYDSYQKFEKDDLVFCLFDYDVTPRTIGHVREDGAMTSAYTRLMPKEDTDSRYYYYYFLYLDYTKELLHLCTGLRNSVSKPTFWSLKSPLPQREEQEKIVDFLDEKITRIDSIIGKKKKLIEFLNEKHTVTINQLITKGLKSNSKFIDSGISCIGTIPKRWRVKKIKYIATKVIDGTHFTPEYTDKGVPFLRVTDLHTKEINLQKIKYISEEEHSILKRRCNPEKGDLLLSKNGTIGIPKVVNWDFEFSIFVSLCLIKLNKEVDPNFLYYIFLSDVITDQINYGSQKTSVTNLHLEKIKEFKVALPPIEEQKMIIRKLDESALNFESALDKVKKSLDLLNEFKSSLISHAVTGKIKI